MAELEILEELKKIFTLVINRNADVNNMNLDAKIVQDLGVSSVGLIYLVEVLSVMIQVTYFKKTGGKRIFKMAPIHHHFELCGWSETRVVAVFSIITAILCLIALMAM